MYVSQTPLPTVSLYIQVCTSWENRLNLLRQIVSFPICFSTFYHLLCLTYDHLCWGYFDRVINDIDCEMGKDTIHSVFFMLLISLYIIAAKHSLLTNVIDFLSSFSSDFPAVFSAGYSYHFRASLLSAISVLCYIFFLDKLSWFHPMVFVLMSSKHVVSPSTPLASNSIYIIA